MVRLQCSHNSVVTAVCATINLVILSDNTSIPDQRAHSQECIGRRDRPSKQHLMSIKTAGVRPVSGLRLRFLDGRRLRSSSSGGHCAETNNESEDKHPNDVRFNPLGIQMISSPLRRRLFGNISDKSVDKQRINEILKRLKSHGLNPKRSKQCSQLSDCGIEQYIPELLATDLSQHYHLLGQKLSADYRKLAFTLVDKPIPEPPNQWLLRDGWTRYLRRPDGSVVTEEVKWPLESELVLDVEVCMSDGQKPTLATAVSPQAWYSWCSHRLTHLNDTASGKHQFDANLSPPDLIPMGRAVHTDKLIVGHNVSFDRSYIKEQYDIKSDRTRFLDTMSLHMCVSGLTQHQRALHYSQKLKSLNGSNGESDHKMSHLWTGVGSLNNLVDVYRLYCDHNHQISKDPRNIFIKGSIEEVIDNFQELMTYCSTDVRLTLEIFKSILPIYFNRFPHPITFMGMLEMSVMYLPVRPSNWNRYISECDSVYNDNQRQLNLSLRDIANSCCSLAKNDQYSQDIWLWDLDWSTQSIRIKKHRNEPKKKRASVDRPPDSEPSDYAKDASDCQSQSEESIVARILATSSQLMKVQPLMPGYPKWYIEFCSKLRYDFHDEEAVTSADLEWEPGPHLISTQMRSVPKLMRLLWNGYPLHYDETHGWGYLTPDYSVTDLPDRVPGAVDDNKNTIYFPIKRFYQFVETYVKKSLQSKTISDSVESDSESSQSSKGIPDLIKGCIFYRLPHREGPDKRVGNPLSKVLFDFKSWATFQLSLY